MNAKSVTKIYVKLNKDEIIKNINNDKETIEYYTGINGTVCTIINWIVFIAFVSSFIVLYFVKHHSFVGSVGWTAVIIIIVKLAAHVIWGLIKLSLLNYKNMVYTDDFWEKWSYKNRYASPGCNIDETLKWLVNLPCVNGIIPNANYIKAVLNGNYLCHVYDGHGEIWDKDSGEKIGFAIDTTLTEKKVDITDEDDLILIITENHNHLTDSVIWNKRGVCEVMDGAE